VLAAVAVAAALVTAGVGIDARSQSEALAVAPEVRTVLQLEGVEGSGERAFEPCSHCHQLSGAGRVDGSIPQLAGQHRSVVIKQLVDIRFGRRENALMDPFAKTLVDPQRLADVAAYLEALPIPRDNGRGPGTDLAEGEARYRRDCASCHGTEGQGNAGDFVPVLAGQHFAYVLRQLRDIATSERKNIHPDMRAIVEGYSPEQLIAVSDYVSRLEWAERQQN